MWFVASPFALLTHKTRTIAGSLLFFIVPTTEVIKASFVTGEAAIVASTGVNVNIT